MASKYYAVKKGRSTGIFLSWAECQKQVTGYPGALFKSFLTLEEAKAFVEGEVEAQGIPQSEKKHNGEADLAQAILREAPDTLLAYVDGSFHSTTREFSYGMVLLWADEGVIEGGSAEGSQTSTEGMRTESFCAKYSDPELASMRNVAGEIKGAEAAMAYALANGYRKLRIYHDYEGIARWCLGDWKTNKEGTKAYKAYYDSVRQHLQVEFVKVAAHTGDRYNEMADKLAKQALGIL